MQAALSAFAIVLLILAAAAAFYPTRCHISGDWLLVQTLTVTLRFNLRRATEIEPVERDQFLRLGTVRVCGVGWPLRRYGWFWNRQLGYFLSLPTNYDDLYLIRFPNRRLLVSPENGRDLLLRSTP